MEELDFNEEIKFYRSKYPYEDITLNDLINRKDLNDILKDGERLRKKELIKFERLEQAYREKIELLEVGMIRKNKENDENKKNLRKALNSIVNILDRIEDFKDIVEEREDIKTLKILNKTLKNIYREVGYIGIEKIKTCGEQFNEDVHYCVEVVENDECENEIIIEEVQGGYKYKGEVIRESKVVVTKNNGGI